jgi:hypothetical protein
MFQLLQDGSSCNTFIRKKINQRSTDYCSKYEKCPFKILRADDVMDYQGKETIIWKAEVQKFGRIRRQGAKKLT